MSDVRPLIRELEQVHIRTDLPDFRVGDTVRVNLKIVEGDKERIQAFEGVCIRRTRGSNRGTFTVRKISYGVGVERIIPLSSPRIESMEVLSRGKVRRNRLYYLRDLRGKAARIKERIDASRKDSGKKARANARRAAAAKAESQPQA